MRILSDFLMLHGGDRYDAIENNGEDNPTKVIVLLNRGEGSTVFPQHDCLGILVTPEYEEAGEAGTGPQ